MGGYKVCIGLVLCFGPRQSLVESTLTLYRVGLPAFCFHIKIKKNCFRLGSVVIVLCHKVLIMEYTQPVIHRVRSVVNYPFATRIGAIYDMRILWNRTLQNGQETALFYVSPEKLTFHKKIYGNVRKVSVNYCSKQKVVVVA